jgi:peptidoglycan/xylan/chitin deacetylase (PgdA/CDA1 family)
MLSPVRQLARRVRWPKLQAVSTRYKPLVRDGLAEVMLRVGATSPARFARGALTIVTFHRVLPADKLRLYPIPGLAVTPGQLEAILAELKQHFACMSVIDAFRLSRAGRANERPPLGISFDDGALDNYEHALPVLDRLGMKASFYIPVTNVDEQRGPWHDRLGFALLRSVALARKKAELGFDRLLLPFGCSVQSFAAVLPDEALSLAARGVAAAKSLSPEQRATHMEALEAAVGGDQVPAWAGMMGWDQVRELHGAGHEVSSHSMTHPLLPDASDESVKYEIIESRLRLQKATGGEVASFCYPNGSYDARCLAAVGAAGYECAVTTAWGLNRKLSPFELKRCDMDYVRLQSRRGEFSKQRLLLRLSGLSPGLTPSSAHY